MLDSKWLFYLIVFLFIDALFFAGFKLLAIQQDIYRTQDRLADIQSRIKTLEMFTHDLALMHAQQQEPYECSIRK